ncbi:cell surface glycoprotein CD200 receptor 1-A-like [Mantella aurantiaca]
MAVATTEFYSLFLQLGLCNVTVAVGRRGSSTDLQCGADTGDQIVGVIWKIHHINNYSCILSYGVILKGGPQTYSTCSTRITPTMSHRTLTIHNTQISDRGNYTCEASYPTGTFINTTLLQVLAQPDVSLGVNSDGSVECRAIDGFPAAEISWIPQSDDISTTKTKDLNDTWTVISTYKFDGDNVTCFVSHPTFVNPWSQSIVLPGDVGNITIWIPVGFAILLLSALCIICWKRKRIRACYRNSRKTSPPQREEDVAEDTAELEPYAMYTQKENALYCEASRVTRLRHRKLSGGEKDLKKEESRQHDVLICREQSARRTTCDVTGARLPFTMTDACRELQVNNFLPEN